MGYKPGEKEGGENHEIRTASLGVKQKYQGYEVKQYNIITNVLGGWCRDLEVGSKTKGVLHNMQKAVISGTLNISRTLKNWFMLSLHISGYGLMHARSLESKKEA